MSIRDVLQKIKQLDKGTIGDLYVVSLILLVGLSSFGLGRLSAQENIKEPVQIATTELSAAYGSIGGVGAEVAPLDESGQLVGSKNGSKYHYPWCSGAQRMNEENKIWFDSVEEARKAGYTPAANCKGLK